MKKLKAILLGFTLCMVAPLAAEDFDWSQFWCNYGAGIEKGDILLSADASFDFGLFGSAYFGLPYIVADLEFALPVWKLPFTFGGYVAASLRFGNDYFAVPILFGGSATYHVRMPPKNLDLYTGLKLGARIAIGDSSLNNFDFGYNIGASWFFTDNFGVNLELGYPYNKTGVVFKF